MISSKVNTKTWTDKPQDTVRASDPNKMLDANEMKKVLGDKELGTFLNEIADKNYVDPKKMRRPEGKMDKDAFLKLMLTQLKYQDPLNPMESHEMASQLAQFSSLEQLSNIDNSIQGLTKSQNPMVNYQALNFLGRTISADTEKIIRTRGDKSHELRFTLPDNARSAKITILDDAGKEVNTVSAANLKKGENKVVWNGTKTDGYPTYAGNYTFKVEAESEKGVKINGKTSFTGTVTGMNYSPEGPILMIGDQKVRLSDVKQIEDETMKFAQNIKENQKEALKSAALPAENTEVEGAKEKPNTNNIDVVPMNDQLRNQIVKETS